MKTGYRTISRSNKKSKKKFKKILRLQNGNVIYQSLWNEAKAVLRREFHINKCLFQEAIKVSNEQLYTSRNIKRKTNE